MVCVRMSRYNKVHVRGRIPGLNIFHQFNANVQEAAIDDDDHPPALISKAEGDRIATLLLGSHFQKIDLIHLTYAFQWTNRGWRSIPRKSVAPARSLALGRNASSVSRQAWRLLARALGQPLGRWRGAPRLPGHVQVGLIKGIHVPRSGQAPGGKAAHVPLGDAAKRVPRHRLADVQWRRNPRIGDDKQLEDALPDYRVLEAVLGAIGEHRDCSHTGSSPSASATRWRSRLRQPAARSSV